MKPSLATITVGDDLARLNCAKGTAEISIPIDGSSIFSNWKAVESIISDLVFLAKPQKSKLVIVTTVDSLAPVETHIIYMIGLSSGAVEIILQSPTMQIGVPLHKQHFSETDSPGWVFRWASRSSPKGILQINRGYVVIAWKGKTASKTIPTHSRLIISDFVALTNAIVFCKRELSMPHGVQLEIANRSEQGLSMLESLVVTDALTAAQLIPANPVPAEKSTTQSMSSLTYMSVCLAMGSILLLDWAYQLSLSPDQLLGVGVAGLIAWMWVDAMRNRQARIRRLEPLLSRKEGPWKN